MSYTFQLSQPLVDYGRALREWSVAECRPYARQADAGHAPPANWREIFDTCPVPLGRWDKPDDKVPTFDEGDWIRELVITESIQYGDTWPYWTIGAGIGHLVVKLMGTPEQIERWYDPIARGGGQTAFGLTEPHFGTDTSMVASTAVRDGDTWLLNGTKMYCSGGAHADYVTMFATTDKSLGPSAIKAFVVPKGTPGMIVGKQNESKLGIRSAVTSEMVFEDCAVPLDHMLGWTADSESDSSSEGQPTTRSGRGGALGALAQNKPNMSAMGVGVAQAAADVAAEELTSRRTGFTPQRWAAIENDLRNMNDALDRMRQMNYKAQFLADRGQPNKTEASMAKAYGPPTVERIIRRCMQLLGPDGTSQDLLLEKWYRDVKILDIFEGSGQVQRIIVGRSLVGSNAG